MAEWNSKQYLKFENQRTQPAIDLISRISGANPRTALDIGCGPGNSSHVVKSAFPNANVLGIDNSQDMIEKAKKTYPDIQFRLCDANAIRGKYDLIFSNACFQWIPEHQELIPELMGKLSCDGLLAAQFPMNAEEPLYQVIKEVAKDPKWGFQNDKLDSHGTLTPHEYFNILNSCSRTFQIWEVKYYHNLPDHKALVEWVKGTRIRPYLSLLTAEQGTAFQEEIIERSKEYYPIMSNGEVILCFKRFFFVAIK